MLAELLQEVEERVSSQNWQVALLVLDLHLARIQRREEKRKKKLSRSKRHRRRLLANNPFCYYCGIGLDLDNSTIDHVIPQCKGGKWTKDNLVLACEGCNRKKGSNYPDRKTVKRLKRCYKNLTSSSETTNSQTCKKLLRTLMESL